MKKQILATLVLSIIFLSSIGIFGQEDIYLRSWENAENLNNYVSSAWADVNFHKSIGASSSQQIEINDNFGSLNNDEGLRVWDNLEAENKEKFWSILDDEGKKKLIKSIELGKRDDFSKGQNEGDLNNRYSELWNDLETEEDRNDILKNLDNDKRDDFIQAILKDKSGINEFKFSEKLTDLDKIEISYKSDGDFERFIIKDPKGGEHVIPMNNLPPKVENIIFAELGGEYGVQYGWDKNKDKRAFLKEGTYLQYEDIGGTEKDIIVKGTNAPKDSITKINFGEVKAGEEVSFRFSKNSAQLWDSKGDIGGNRASIEFKSNIDTGEGVESSTLSVFPHPKGSQTPSGLRYASLNLLEGQENVYKVWGAGTTTANEGLGFYFKDEGVLDLTGKYDNKEKLSSLKFYRDGNKRFLEGSFEGKNPVSFTIGEDTTVKVGNSELSIPSKDSENWNQYSYTSDLEEYVQRNGKEYSNSLVDSSGNPKERVGGIKQDGKLSESAKNAKGILERPVEQTGSLGTQKEPLRTEKDIAKDFEAKTNKGSTTTAARKNERDRHVVELKKFGHTVSSNSNYAYGELPKEEASTEADYSFISNDGTEIAVINNEYYRWVGSRLVTVCGPGGCRQERRPPNAWIRINP